MGYLLINYKGLDMKTISYNGYVIYLPYKNKRISVDGSGISCNRFWYSLESCKRSIDFAEKFVKPTMTKIRGSEYVPALLR